MQCDRNKRTDNWVWNQSKTMKINRNQAGFIRIKPNSLHANIYYVTVIMANEGVEEGVEIILGEFTTIVEAQAYVDGEFQ